MNWSHWAKQDCFRNCLKQLKQHCLSYVHWSATCKEILTGGSDCNISPSHSVTWTYLSSSVTWDKMTVSSEWHLILSNSFSTEHECDRRTDNN